MRTYERTHPWITFGVDLRGAGAPLWISLGEAQSKCEHLAGVPLTPDAAHRLHLVYLAKGIHATTQIEGNTLTEDEVRRRIESDLDLPPSKEYLGKEVDNIVRATNKLLQDVEDLRINEALTAETISMFNGMVLEGLALPDHAVPGRVRSVSVGVGAYRGAPAEDCGYLLERLCEWLSGPDFAARPGMQVVYGIIKAVLAHIYLAWIHPFGDGNGRTARLLEVKILLEAGIPSAAAHLLSNHYNQTRSEYYRYLSLISNNGGDVLPFLEYAVQGFVDQLREQIRVVQEQVADLVWNELVHATFPTKGDHRKRHLLLAVSARKGWVNIKELRRLTPDLAIDYKDKTTKTISRDINALTESKMLERAGSSVRARTEMVRAFLSIRNKGPTAP